MVSTTWRVLLVAVLGLLAARAPGAAARKQKPSQPKNATFPSCNTGTSRIVLANLEKLSTDCKPAHNHLAAAIYTCFATSKVKVENCQVTIHPAGKAAKINPICKVVHAQGMLQGPSNASLVGVINQAKLDKFVKEHPDTAGSGDTAAVQKLCADTLARLFGRTVLLQGKSKCSAVAVGTGHKVKDTKGAKNHSNSGVEASAAAPEGASPGRKRPGRRKKGTGAAATAAAAAPNTGNSTAAAGPNNTAAATLSAATGNGSTASEAISSYTTTGNSSTSSDGSNAAVIPAAAAAAAAAQPGNGTGRRRLLFDIEEKEQQRSTSRHLSENSTKATATVPAVADKPCTGNARYDPDADFQAALANSSSSTGNSKGSVLYLQGTDDIILQPSQQCRFQYLVPKNPNLLQPTGKPSTRAAAIAPVAAARRAGGGGGGGGGAVAEVGQYGHIAWIVFSSVSVVLGAAVVYMMVKLVARRSDLKQRYDAIQTSEPAATVATNSGTVQLVPTAAGGDQRDQQQRPDSAGGKAAEGAGLELSDTASRGDKSRLLKDNRRSDGSTATGK